MAFLTAGIQVLDAATVLSWLALLVVLYPAAQASYYLFFHPLHKYPGPKLAACTRLVNLYWVFRGTEYMRIKELHDQYGDIVRIGPNFLVYRTPIAWKEIYGHRKSGEKPFLREPDYYPEDPGGGGPSIFNIDGPNHSRIRRLMTHAFSDKSLRDQESLVQSYVDFLLEQLHGEVAACRNPVEITRWYNYATFDVIGDLAFGEPFGCLRDKRYHPWVLAVFDAAFKTLALGRLLLSYPRLQPLVGMMLPMEIFKKRPEFFKLSKTKVDRRLETQTNRPDFITHILRHTDERGMTKQELYSNIDVLIIAGSETSATALSGLTFYLLRNPEAYKSLVDEIRRAFPNKEEITFQSIARLKYLNASLEESLRLYPPVPAIAPRRVQSGGAMIEGQFIPEGTTVSMGFYSAFRSKANFSQPDSFIPERWIDTKNPRFASDNRDALQPFSYGHQSCIGQTLAYAEMRLITAKLLWAFDLSFEEDCSNWAKQEAYLIWKKDPLMVELTPVQR